MALALRESDKKLISVSFKKLKVYEGIYTSPLDQALPSEKMLRTFQHQEVVPAWEDGEESAHPAEGRPPLLGESEQAGRMTLVCSALLRAIFWHVRLMIPTQIWVL